MFVDVNLQPTIEVYPGWTIQLSWTVRRRYQMNVSTRGRHEKSDLLSELLTKFKYHTLMKVQEEVEEPSILFLDRFGVS